MLSNRLELLRHDGMRRNTFMTENSTRLTWQQPGGCRQVGVAEARGVDFHQDLVWLDGLEVHLPQL
jgi:hypothetical protein